MSFINQGNQPGTQLFAQPTTNQAQQFQPLPSSPFQQPVNQQAIPTPMFQQQFQNPLTNQQPQPVKFNLLGPINAGIVDKSLVDSVNAILSSVKNDVDRIINRLLSEHQAGRENIDHIFNAVNLQGCYLDVLYKPNQPMCPSFSLSKQLRAGTQGMFGGAAGSGISINGVVKNIQSSPYASDPGATKMNEIVKAFVQIADMLSKAAINDSFEVRTNTANISYIASTGVVCLTPSTLILNDNKNDARKLASKI